MSAFAGTPALSKGDPVGALSAEAVRKDDFQGRMWERAGSAVGFAGGLGFHSEGALIAWMSGCTPRMAIIRFRL
jgi:hypothetical protein